MGTATLEKSAGDCAPNPAARNLDRSILRALMLVRIAARDGATRTNLKKDIFVLVSHKLSPAEWRQSLDMDLAVLKADGCIREKSGRLHATDAGVAATTSFLGVKGKLPAEWPVIRDRHLMAKALGRERASAKLLGGLEKPDGLRALVLQKAYGLKVKGVPTAARVRLALAMVALQRAFGNQISGGLASGAGLSAKASRLLAGQLARRPRDFGTDRRLLAGLAAEVSGAIQTDIPALQTALLRKLLAGQALHDSGPAAPQATSSKWRRKSSSNADGSKADGSKADCGKTDGDKAGRGANRRRRATTKSKSRPPVAPARASPATQHDSPAPRHNGFAREAPVVTSPAQRRGPVSGRPDLPGFAKEIHRQAGACAEGWSGDRKAFISRVWQLIRSHHPEWGLSAIEFKCMLAEAHQAGHILLAYADLKDKDNIKDVQDSAIAYKNMVWHYIRVED